MQISLIVACADNGVIGTTDGRIPWHLPTDQQYFKTVTMGHPVIMGRTTYETIGHPLSGRQNIVVTHTSNFEAPGCTVVHTIEEALQAAQTTDEIFIIGGGTMYQQTLPLASKIYLTRVHATPEGEVLFQYDPTEWTETSTEHHPADDRNDYDYTFSVLTRSSQQ